MAKGFTGGFTVLIAVYGGDDSALFRTALESIFSNTLQPTRTVLVVDGPVPDGVEQVIASFEGNKALTVYRLTKNKGLFNALNYGLKHIRQNGRCGRMLTITTVQTGSRRCQTHWFRSGGNSIYSDRLFRKSIRMGLKLRYAERPQITRKS